MNQVTHTELFGTDGVRGIANGESMTPEFALRLGRALGVMLQRHRPTRSVVIGKDTRWSGYMLETALSSGLCSVGVDVWLCGPLPTPAIAYLTHALRSDAGVVVSASHNPYYDNGIKIFNYDGFKLPDAKEHEIETLFAERALDDIRPTHAQIGRAHRIEGAAERYVTYLKTAFPKEYSLGGLRVVVDAAHGSAYRIAPMVLEELGAQVIALGNHPDGLNINEGVGALHPEVVQAKVKESGAQLGIALDGDSDRIIAVDEKGEIVDGDQLMALLALEFQATDRLRGDGLVATVMSNIGLEVALADCGLMLHRAPVGDRYVVEEMRRRGCNLGGEQSGHIISLDHATTGDGVIAALLLLSAMLRTQKPLSELRRCMQLFPQRLISIAIARKQPVNELATVSRLIREAEQSLGTYGRILVRYSGTEMKARVMVEGENPIQVTQLAEAIASEMQRALS